MTRGARRALSGHGLLGAAIASCVGGLVLVGVAIGVRGGATAADVAPIATPPRASNATPQRAAPEPSAASGPVALADLPDPAWIAVTSASTGIPERALRAYAGAAIRLADEDPGCALGWNTLAGIGHVESEHGTIDGEQIGAEGRTPTPIIGIPLDGVTTDAIRDTDGGALDGDDVWDRAVGPLQFIPSTWREWAADGDGDGLRDPHQIDDAALSAARYLCAGGSPLTGQAAWIAAVTSYNSAPSYVVRVADAAAHYASR